MTEHWGLSRGFGTLENCVADFSLQPPNAAKHGCHIFDEATGKKSHVQQCHFYSELGIKN